MKKRLLAAILAALMLTSSLAACSESNAGTNTDETQPANSGSIAAGTETEEAERN